MKSQLSSSVLIILMILFSCSKSKIEKVKDNLVQRTTNKINETGNNMRKNAVEKVFEYTTTIKSSRFEDIYGKNSSVKIKNQEGIQIEYIADFYQCFFRYTTKKEKLLIFLDNLDTTRPEISDKKHSASDIQIIDEKLAFLHSKFPDLYKKLGFFTEFYEKKNLQYYKINKYPYSNIIIYDKKNETIYHFVENYQE